MYDVLQQGQSNGSLTHIKHVYAAAEHAAPDADVVVVKCVCKRACVRAFDMGDEDDDDAARRSRRTTTM